MAESTGPGAARAAREGALVLVLLVSASPIGAVTCVRDQVPAATLLVPYFRVSRGGTDGADPIPAQGVNTVLSITNVGGTGVVTHVTVHNKYSRAVLGFNVPLDAYGTAFFDMRQILNGDLNLNRRLQRPGRTDPCTESPGFGRNRYARFTNPDGVDLARAVSIHAPVAGPFLAAIRDSLDESGDVPSFLSAKTANILDRDNPACGDVATGFPETDGQLAGDFSGYLTIDVVNYCTQHGPSDGDALYFVNDAIATTGWASSSGGLHTPNTLIGDIFHVDATVAGGNVSGEPMVALEFDARLSEPGCNWVIASGEAVEDSCKTFYNRFSDTPGGRSDGTATPLTVPARYRAIGDGREPLPSRYAFRYLSDVNQGLASWAVAFRSDLWAAPRLGSGTSTSLCDWWAGCLSTDINSCRGWGTWDTRHMAAISMFNNDEAVYTAYQGGGCGICQALPTPYLFLGSARMTLAGNPDIGLNDPKFRGGWIDLQLGGNPPTHQAWVGVQHSAPGQLVSVGHGASVRPSAFVCVPSLLGAGSVVN